MRGMFGESKKKRGVGARIRNALIFRLSRILKRERKKEGRRPPIRRDPPGQQREKRDKRGKGKKEERGLGWPGVSQESEKRELGPPRSEKSISILRKEKRDGELFYLDYLPLREGKRGKEGTRGRNHPNLYLFSSIFDT